MPSCRRLAAPCTRVAHAHCFRARLVLERKRAVVVRLTLDLAPDHGRPRRATATVAIVGAGARTPGPAAAVAAVVALVAAWRATSGIRSPAAAIFVVGATVAIIAAAPTVVTAVAAAAAAPLAARTATAVHAYSQSPRWIDRALNRYMRETRGLDQGVEARGVDLCGSRQGKVALVTFNSHSSITLVNRKIHSRPRAFRPRRGRVVTHSHPPQPGGLEGAPSAPVAYPARHLPRHYPHKGPRQG